MDFSECVKVLHSLGLSEYEARVYVSLVTEGASEGRKVSMRGGVPRTKVYATLKKLKERGLVYELPQEPQKFAPVSPAKAFEAYMEHLKEETSKRVISLIQSRKLVSLLEETYKKTRSTITPQREEVWIFQGWFNILRKMREMLSRAKKSVVVVTTENGFILFYKTVGRLLDKLVENGVNVQIRTSVNSHNRHLARELNYVCKVKNVDVNSPILFLYVDDREFLLVKLARDDFNLDSSMHLGIFSRNPYLRDLISLLLPRQIRKPFSRRTIKVQS